MHHSEDILHFWFGELADRYDLGENARMWWQKSDDIDRNIIETFGADLEGAAAGALDDWIFEPRPALALIIVLDQFSRNAYRGQARAFAQDARAVDATLRAIDLGHHAALRAAELQFLYMPLMHAEDIALHEDLARRIDEVIDALPEDKRPAYEPWRRSATKHADIVRRFGRYPHRNAVLGRPSTPEEEAFLAQPGSSF